MSKTSSDIQFYITHAVHSLQSIYFATDALSNKINNICKVKQSHCRP
jgi:hypothetical protein